MFHVPPAARTACWLNAWLAGREPADDVVFGIAPDGATDFWLDPGAAPVAPALLLAELRRRGVSRVTVALPLPGHLIGLGGPAAFNTDVLEAGQALLLVGTGLGLIPLWLGSGVRWRSATADEPAFLPDVASAARDLRTAFGEASERLADLDVASWNPDIADAILNLRRPIRLDPRLPFASNRAAESAVMGLRAEAIVGLAAQDDSGPVTAVEAAEREAALRPLQVAARTAVVAACSCLTDR